MGEPQTRTSEIEDGADGPLARAAVRLQRALDGLEDALERHPPASTAVDQSGRDRTEALVIELDAARRRGRDLEAAAAGASAALGRAMAEVRRTLDEDAERQGLLDFAAEEPASADPAADAALEIAPASDEEEAAKPAEEDPAE